jgi:protoporphyrinogen oxidase
MEGSFQLFIDTLASRIREMGGKILTNTPVERLTIEGRKVKEVTAGKVWPVDQVIATVPSFVFLQIAPDLPEEYASRLREVSYQSALCLVLKMKRSLSRIYWLNISDPAIPFVGAIEHTNFISREEYNGKHILYLSNYVSSGGPLYGASAEELFVRYLPSLRKINPEFEQDWVEEMWLFREDAAQPVITCGYSRRVPGYQTPVQGLYLANTTQIYPQDRGMNYSVRLGKVVSEIAA